jgi:hypothetical protein
MLGLAPRVVKTSKDLSVHVSISTPLECPRSRVTYTQECSLSTRTQYHVIVQTPSSKLGDGRQFRLILETEFRSLEE